MLSQHGAGHCEALYDSRGSLIVTGGTDSALVLRDADSNEEVNLVMDEHDYQPISALALDPSSHKLITGCASGTVRVFSFPGLQYESNLCRFDTKVRSLTFSSDSKFVAAVPEDSSHITIIEANPNDGKVVKFELVGHNHFVRDVAFDPLGMYLASSGGDGALLVWHMSRGVAPDMEKAFASAKFMKDAKDSPDRHLQQLAWRPDGRVLAVPYAGNSVCLLKAGSWQEAGRLKGGAFTGGHNEDVSVLAWSQSGRYLASGDISGRVVFWDASNGVVIDSRTVNDSIPVTSLAWDPTRNAVVAGDVTGNVLLPWEGVIPADLPPPFATIADLAEEEKVAEVAAPAAAPAAEPVAAESAAKSASLVDDEAEADSEKKEDDLTDEEEAVRADSEDLYKGSGAADKFSHVVQSIEARVKAGEAAKASEISNDEYFERHAVKETRAQPAFCSNATPEEDQRRQLAWNLVGRVTSVERVDHCSVEVEFEDTTRHRRPVNFQDSSRYTMADLSETGAVFGAPSRGMLPSRLHFRFFDTWDRPSWLCELQEGEDVVSVAVGKKCVVAATSLRHLRVFSYAGLQLMTLSVPGPVVTLAMSDTDMLGVVYHSGRGLPTEQSLALQLWDLTTRKTHPSQQLPLSPGEVTLIWLGYATNGVLCSCDSAGVVRAQLSGWDYNWSPIADITRCVEVPAGSKLALVGINLDCDLQHLQCVPYRDTRDFPPVLPKPLPLQAGVKLDLLDSSDMQEQYEPVLRQRFLVGAVDNARLAGQENLAAGLLRDEQRALVKLLMTCAKADEGSKLLELCGLAEDRKQMLGFAAKVANQFRKGPLVAKVQQELEEMDADVALEHEFAAAPEEAVPPPAAPAKKPPSRHAEMEEDEEEEDAMDPTKAAGSESEEDAGEDDIAALVQKPAAKPAAKPRAAEAGDEIEELEDVAEKANPFGKSPSLKKSDDTKRCRPAPQPRPARRARRLRASARAARRRRRRGSGRRRRRPRERANVPSPSPRVRPPPARHGLEKAPGGRGR
jgi:chromosome transmission fidelity protein 4